jgi:hypothetical protein
MRNRTAPWFTPFAETGGIIEELRTIGVDFAQGYGVCKPTPLLGALGEGAIPPALRVAAA